MERIEIYSSKEKSILLLIGSLVFVVLGIFMIINAENPTSYIVRNQLVIIIIGTASVLFFGLGIYVSIKQLLKNELILIIDRNGINVNPKKSKTDFIEWKYINGFTETKIQSQKIIIIEVDNSKYWIEKEKNNIRNKVMNFNFKYYGSPFNLSANSMKISHHELMKTLNENLNKYKYNA
ncbi:hypothetical protein K5I29_02440 [Flavobacterium agricola]|uniref:Uncharacterized protein n=1 Tax=Flavobacterium agricola TaxID=2870839 RepID=A0ABY6LZS4_9FLAO|nr:STM3941 family protein [Flavobacterium agricola]UYW01803.1 hypothetical protein K5I29_02440 [Flavobacterium agricola]